MLAELLLPLLAAFAVAAVGTAVVRTFARRHGLVVHPRQDRWHERPTALYGGVAIACAAILVPLVVFGEILQTHPAATAILAAGVVLFAVGLYDDARGIGPVGKFILQLTAGTLLIVAGVVYPLTPWNPVNVLITLFWFVGIVNALNLLDNMDGVTAGASAIAALAFAAFFAAAGDFTLAALSVATAGAAAGFLVFNFKPASIFMGDSGSLFLGAMLAGLGAAYPLAGGTNGGVALLVPALVLLVPILDTALVTVTRTIHNRKISVGGRDHSTHRLVAMGFSERRAAILLYGLGILSFMVAWGVAALEPAAGLVLGTFFLAAALVFAGYLGRLHRYTDGPTREVAGRGLLIRNILLKRRGLELLLDVILFGVAYYGAFVIYYDGSIPVDMGPTINGTLAVVIVLKLAAFHYFRVYRGVWDRAGLADVHRIAKATLLGTLLAVAVLFILVRGAEIPRSVFAIDALLTGALAASARISFRSLERFRHRLQRDDRAPVLVYGAGPEADVILNALPVCGAHLRPIGYLDERSQWHGTLIHGLPVLGGLEALPSVLELRGVAAIVILDSVVDDPKLSELFRICTDREIEVLSIRLSLHHGSSGFDGNHRVDPSHGRTLEHVDPAHILETPVGRR